MFILSIAQLRIMLKTHQKRLQVGDKLKSMTELASIAGIHRDTLYALIAGKKISQRSQYAISKALWVISQTSAQGPTKLLSIELGKSGPQLNFGLGKFNVIEGR